MKKRKKMNMDEILRKYWPSASHQEVESAGERVWKRLEAELDKHDTSLRSLYGDGWSATPLCCEKIRGFSGVTPSGLASGNAAENSDSGKTVKRKSAGSFSCCVQAGNDLAVSVDDLALGVYF